MKNYANTYISDHHTKWSYQPCSILLARWSEMIVLCFSRNKSTNDLNELNEMSSTILWLSVFTSPTITTCLLTLCSPRTHLMKQKYILTLQNPRFFSCGKNLGLGAIRKRDFVPGLRELRLANPTLATAKRAALEANERKGCWSPDSTGVRIWSRPHATSGGTDNKPKQFSHSHQQ